MELSNGRYAGRTADERRLERHRRLLDAALDIAGSHGISALRVRAVCVRAGLNDRYFYESFSDCDQLLLAVFEDQAATLVNQLMSALSDAASEQLTSRIRTVIEVGIDFCAEDPRRRRLLEESQSSPALRARRNELTTLLAEMLLAQGQVVIGDHVATDPRYRMAALTVVNGLIELAASWWRGELDASRNEIAEFMVAMILTTADIGTQLESRMASQNQG